MAKDGGDHWDKLTWGNKVSICEQARASENYLLHVYIMIFMAIQAVLFALLVGFWNILLPWARCIIPVCGVLFATFWAYVIESRGNKVDLWGKMLYTLWKGTSQSESVLFEVTECYKGAADRWDRRKNDRCATFKGWGCWGRFKSDRWVFVMFLPSFLILLWLGWLVQAIVYFVN